MKRFVHLYYGDGKGKTTAAMGLALRAAAHGESIVIVQFLKSGSSGEIDMLRGVSGVTVFRGKAGNHFASHMTNEEKAATKAMHDRHLRQALHLAYAGYCGMLILDEITAACAYGLIDEALVQKTVIQPPENTELVLTGRDAPEWMRSRADYCTRLVKEKHPFDLHVPARAGIEY
ncbi:MAG TPA: cob(I)yrinic acid a,c-diamide adenosyltransferase [Candidatus Treponema faecavium]|nr:cob(I)yrinic acid a,c-diamide adenosyltransferase [Candidatus Treponema faecavium]